MKHEGGVRAVFGPSLNGLGASDIVLCGEIEDTHAKKILSDWLNEAAARRWSWLRPA